MKEHGTGKGKTNTSSEMISLVTRGEILIFMDIWIAGNEFDIILLNPFLVTGLFLCPLQTSGNLLFSDLFRGYRKRPVA